MPPSAARCRNSQRRRSTQCYRLSLGHQAISNLSLSDVGPLPTLEGLLKNTPPDWMRILLGQSSALTVHHFGAAHGRLPIRIWFSFDLSVTEEIFIQASCGLAWSTTDSPCSLTRRNVGGSKLEGYQTIRCRLPVAWTRGEGRGEKETWRISSAPRKCRRYFFIDPGRRGFCSGDIFPLIYTCNCNR